MTPPEAHQFFKETFGQNLNGMLDGMMCVLTGKPVLDMYKFDDFLHTRHGNYEESGQSMEDVIRANYGEDVLGKVKSLLGIE